MTAFPREHLFVALLRSKPTWVSFSREPQRGSEWRVVRFGQIPSVLPWSTLLID